MYGSESWHMKGIHEVKLGGTELSVIRWTCGFPLKG